MESFQTGNPAVVYGEAEKLIAAYRELLGEAARLRYKLNFGTAVCENCDGLHAGPGVIATCYQVRECHFTNLREAPTRHLRVLDHLTKE